VYEAAYRAGYDVVVITLTRLPCVIAITTAVVLSYLAYRHLTHRRRLRPPKRGAWPAMFVVLALYGCLAALAPGGWDEPLVLLGVTFAALAGYAWLDPTRKAPLAGAAETSGGRRWFG
jgi:multisubunit Na+/H+ antiporter MnhB subunit